MESQLGTYHTVLNEYVNRFHCDRCNDDLLIIAMPIPTVDARRASE